MMNDDRKNNIAQQQGCGTVEHCHCQIQNVIRYRARNNGYLDQNTGTEIYSKLQPNAAPRCIFILGVLASRRQQRSITDDEEEPRKTLLTRKDFSLSPIVGVNKHCTMLVQQSKQMHNNTIAECWRIGFNFRLFGQAQGQELPKVAPLPI